ncbi:hypothetical protein HDA41_000167 [Streptomyces caelestis]|uniref:Uncharacterized protein n=1 Tax=Streptomyces caelestis TaxID=36816 RepID=A0A7W9GYQ7_9ACTN|nr:hypothetical protein [Streptomyces caelestis]
MGRPQRIEQRMHGASHSPGGAPAEMPASAPPAAPRLKVTSPGRRRSGPRRYGFARRVW